MVMQTNHGDDKKVVVVMSEDVYDLVFQIIEDLFTGELPTDRLNLTPDELFQFAASPTVADEVIADQRNIAEKVGIPFDEEEHDREQIAANIALDAKAYRELLAAKGGVS